MGFEFFHQGFDRAGVVGMCGQIDFVFFAVYFECDVGIGQVEFFGKAAEQDFATAVIRTAPLGTSCRSSKPDQFLGHFCLLQESFRRHWRSDTDTNRIRAESVLRFLERESSGAV